MGKIMAKLRLKYVNEYTDNTGRTRRYFRRNGKQLGPLPGIVGSEEFMEAYRGYLTKQPPTKPKSALPADSLAAFIQNFYTSRMFTDLKPATRAAYRAALDPVIKANGSRLGTDMTAEHAEKIISRIGDTRPGMGNLTRAAMRRVFKLAVKEKRRPDNPFLGIESYSVGSHHSWTEAELRQYEAFWRLGTRERLAYDLLLYTTQRVGDVAKMKRADMADGWIHVVQQKTGAELWVPVFPQLVRSLAAYPVAGMTLIGDPAGRQIKRATLSGLIRGAVKKAGLPSICVPHGLRKAGMRRLAEGGATAKQIASMSGHKTLKEIENYTKAADQKMLARDAMLKMTKEQ
jgi:integrase